MNTHPNMRELDRIPIQACALLHGVVFDIDDTVTSGGRLERQAYDAMWEAQEHGLSLVAVTGRPLGWAEVIARTWPVAFAVGENGAGWCCSQGGRCRTFYWNDEATRVRQRALLDRVRQTVNEQAPWAQLADDQWARRCDVAFDIGEHTSVTPPQIRQLTALVHGCGARVLTSSVHLHAVPGDYDKPQATARAAQQLLGADLDTDRARWLYVGDSPNDDAAFAWFPLSAGVANVRACLARLDNPPAYVASLERGAGFAQIVAAVLAHRR